MRVLILAAGYGTRLYPLTLDLPKTFLLIDEEPLLNHIIKKVDGLKKTVNLDEIIIVTNNKFYRRFLDWKEEFKREDIKILNDGSNDPGDKRGVVGDIKFAIGNNRDNWLILGSDNFFNWGLEEFVSFSLERAPSPVVGIYDIKNKESASQFGVVKINKDSLIEEFIEKPEIPKSSLVATCLYFFSGESLNFIDKYIGSYENVDMAGQYISWLTSKTKTYSFLFKGIWLDIGSREALEEATTGLRI